MPLIVRPGKRALEPEAVGDAKIHGNSCVCNKRSCRVVESVVVVRNDDVKVAEIGERDM